MQKPTYFWHIPKTAGTSVLTSLQNTFSDQQVKRIRIDDEPDYYKDPTKVIGSAIDRHTCIVGHTSISDGASQLNKVCSFTILRDPIDRVISLHRFLLTRPKREIAPFGLSATSSLEDLLDSSSPDIQIQLRNGMCRFLTPLPALVDPSAKDGSPLLESALATLDGMHVGFVEQLEPSLRMIWQELGIPFDPVLSHENRTDSATYGVAPSIIARIAEINVLDIALYRTAYHAFVARQAESSISRMRRLSIANHAAVFNMPASCFVPVGSISGRSGFFGTEDIGCAWLAESPEINFTAQPSTRTLNLRFYTIIDSYPVKDALFVLNGKIANLIDCNVMEQRHYSVTIDLGGLVDGINTLAIKQPFTIRVQALVPTSLDRRSLGMALKGLESRP